MNSFEMAQESLLPWRLKIQMFHVWFERRQKLRKKSLGKFHRENVLLQSPDNE